MDALDRYRAADAGAVVRISRRHRRDFLAELGLPGFPVGKDVELDVVAVVFAAAEACPDYPVTSSLSDPLPRELCFRMSADRDSDR